MVAMAFVANAWAVDPFTVRDIRVEGLQRVEPGTIFASLPFRIGDQYNDEKGSAAIRALFTFAGVALLVAVPPSWWSGVTVALALTGRSRQRRLRLTSRNASCRRSRCSMP